MWKIRCRITVLDADRFPWFVEASFRDAHGRDVCIRDKEPMFRCGDEPEGAGVVRCSLVSGALMGEGDAICVVTTDRPDGLEALDGATRFEVRARQLAPVTPLPVGWFHADREQARRLLDELHRELPPDHPLDGVRLETFAHRDGATDDVAFRHLDEPERFTVVHLTWSGRTELDRDHPTIELDGPLELLIAEEQRRWGLGVPPR